MTFLLVGKQGLWKFLKKAEILLSGGQWLDLFLGTVGSNFA